MLAIRGSNPTVTDSLAVVVSAETAIGRPTATARRLVNASLSDNIRRAYAGALSQLDGRQLDDAGPGRQPRRAPRRRPRRLERRVTAHSGRVGLASELTSRGASTTDVMLAGNWKTSRMVAHYSAGATAERGAVARYL